MPTNKNGRDNFIFDGFEGFETPKATYTPDIVFDVLAPNLKEAELRVLLYIIRRTFGFKKDNDNISISQMVGGITKADGTVLDRGTGMAKAGVVRGINGLVEKGIIVAQRNRSREKGNEATTYTLRFKGAVALVPLSPKETRGGLLKRQALVSQRDTQVTVEQVTVRQETDLISNRFDGDANLQQTSKSKFSKKQRKISTKPQAQAAEEDPPQREHRNGFAPIADALSSRVEKLRSQSVKTGARTAATPRSGNKSHAEPDEAASRSRGRPKKYPVPPDLEQFTKDITLEFHDSSKLASNLSFVGRVLEESGLGSSYLFQLMQEARTLTKRRGNIEKPSEDDVGTLNKFPYFRQTLMDLIEKEGKVVSPRRNQQGRQSGVI
jgi:hypothetical protein